MLMANFNIRHREIPILLLIGARPLNLAALFVFEAIFIAGVSCLL